MIETKVPKDIRKYKTKLIGPLTLRQLICLVIAIIFDAILYFAIKALDMTLSINVIIYGIIFLDLPILSFIMEPEGMPMEKYLFEVLLPQFTTKTKRIAENNLSNDDRLKQKTSKEIKNMQQKQKSIERKNPDLKAYK